VNFSCASVEELVRDLAKFEGFCHVQKWCLSHWFFPSNMTELRMAWLRWKVRLSSRNAHSHISSLAEG
jgi:hypothetical protein